MKLDSGIDILRGVGEKKKQALNAAGISTIQDLLYYFPRRYLDRTLTRDILLKEGEVITVLGTVKDRYVAHGRKTMLIVGFLTPDGQRINLVFFRGVPWFQKIFKPGMSLAVSGKLEYFRGFQLVHPDYEIISSPDEADEDNLYHVGRIIPLYPSGEALKKEGFDSRGFRNLFKQIVDAFREGFLLPEVLPERILEKRKLPGRMAAFAEIHFPESEESLAEARRRFIYEELYFFNLLMEYKRGLRMKIKRELWPVPGSKSAAMVVKNLPFKLTRDQQESLDTINSLGQGEHPYAVLLQGDVGSGKTITALLAALHYVDNDVQVALVAPTEILARQHFNSILAFMGNLPFLGIELLLGGENKKARAEKLAGIRSGNTLIAIGTHSLFQEDVVFRDLGLVIYDEQHKFGVEQRESLRSKGKNPDILAMTATPIPRTLCLTLYGDLQLVTIRHKPKGRKPVETKWFTDKTRQGVYNSIRKYVGQGRQCYIIYPLVEESEKLDLKSCIESHAALARDVFPEFNVGLLHGRMKNEEKKLVMDKFKKNEIQILVSTTVVEVGVDVPNATVLVIEHAERFGISQLHQLRGRVGRGEHESFCILMTAEDISDEGKFRIQALLDSTDGFILAEEDLKLRGPGEMLGVRQSGLPDFRIADLSRDAEILAQSREDAAESGQIGQLEKTEIRLRFEEGNLLFPA